jgi:hypothetical protein
LIWTEENIGDSEYDLNIKNISDGIYFIQITNSDGSASRKQIQIIK